REGLPREPRRCREPADRDQQGQGAAVLHRRERVVLAAEPPRTFPDHWEIGQEGQEGREGQGGGGGEVPPLPPPPPPPPPLFSPPRPPPLGTSPLSVHSRTGPESRRRSAPRARGCRRCRSRRSSPAPRMRAPRAARPSSSRRTNDTPGVNRS